MTYRFFGLWSGQADLSIQHGCSCHSFWHPSHNLSYRLKLTTYHPLRHCVDPMLIGWFGVVAAALLRAIQRGP
jgi:hypothetical protein